MVHHQRTVNVRFIQCGSGWGTSSWQCSSNVLTWIIWYHIPWINAWNTNGVISCIKTTLCIPSSEWMTACDFRLLPCMDHSPPEGEEITGQSNLTGGSMFFALIWPSPHPLMMWGRVLNKGMHERKRTGERVKVLGEIERTLWVTPPVPDKIWWWQNKMMKCWLAPIIQWRAWMEVGTKGTGLRSVKSTRPGKERQIEKLEWDIGQRPRWIWSSQNQENSQFSTPENQPLP